MCPPRRRLLRSSLAGPRDTSTWGVCRIGRLGSTRAVFDLRPASCVWGFCAAHAGVIHPSGPLQPTQTADASRGGSTRHAAAAGEKTIHLTYKRLATSTSSSHHLSNSVTSTSSTSSSSSSSPTLKGFEPS